MSNMTRSIKRGIIFKNMNKQQRVSYKSATPEGRKEFERELGEKLKLKPKAAYDKYLKRKIYIPREKEGLDR